MLKMKIHDYYCWKCGKINTTEKCSMCIRSFHDKCVSSEQNQKDCVGGEWTCPVCIHLKRSVNNDK